MTEFYSYHTKFVAISLILNSTISIIIVYSISYDDFNFVCMSSGIYQVAYFYVLLLIPYPLTHLLIEAFFYFLKLRFQKRIKEEGDLCALAQY